MKTIELDVRVIAPREKHPTIFKNFDELNAGDALVITNDHDPKPLYYQMLAERGKTFEWLFLKEGPDVWQVKITKRDKTIGEIAANDLKKVKVFMKYGIDFCCGGNKTLKEACEEKGIDYQSVEKELNQTTESSELDFNSMPLHELTQYIIQKHHQYIKNNQEILLGLAEKVKERHGALHPELIQIHQLFNALINELNTHLMKEENILFPAIEKMSINKTLSFASLQSPISVMFHEHDIAGDLIKQIRKLSNDYSAPQDACNSYAALYRLLKEFDDDLMIHIHLENNILFPKAIQLEKELI